jgi:cytochrome c
MMNKSLAAIPVLIIAWAGPAFAATDAVALADAKHCTACHDAKAEKYGPSFRDIARRFRGLNNAKPMLVRIVQSGTDTPSAVYHWGASKMPPDSVRAPVSEAESEVLVDYVLSVQ